MERLMEDPDLGPMIRKVPEEASWFGGDVMLAVMANVFVGNPASTMSQFMAESRLALGLGHNNMYMARDENCQWKKACGDRCLFRPNWGGAFDPSTSSHCKSVEVTKLSSEVV